MNIMPRPRWECRVGSAGPGSDCGVRELVPDIEGCSQGHRTAAAPAAARDRGFAPRGTAAHPRRGEIERRPQAFGVRDVVHRSRSGPMDEQSDGGRTVRHHRLRRRRLLKGYGSPVRTSYPVVPDLGPEARYFAVSFFVTADGRPASLRPCNPRGQVQPMRASIRGRIINLWFRREREHVRPITRCGLRRDLPRSSDRASDSLTPRFPMKQSLAMSRSGHVIISILTIRNGEGEIYEHTRRKSHCHPRDRNGTLLWFF